MPPRNYERVPLPTTVNPPEALTASNTSCPYIESIEVRGGLVEVSNSKLQASSVRALVLSAIGMTDEQIAGNIGIHSDTITEIQRETRSILGAKTRPQAVDMAFQRKMFIVRRGITLPQLSERQTDIIQMAAKGIETKDYADELAIDGKSDAPISMATLRTHERRVMRKLEVPTMASAVLLANLGGLLRPIHIHEEQPDIEEESFGTPRYTFEEWKQMFFPFAASPPEGPGTSGE